MDQLLGYLRETPHLPTGGRCGLNNRQTDETHPEGRTPIVYVGDADIVTRVRLIRETGWQPRLLESLEAVACSPETVSPSCVVLDISRPGALCYHKRIVALSPEISVVCTAGDVDLALVVSFVKAGAFDVLRKPTRDDLLLDAIRRALERSEAVVERGLEIRQLRDRYSTLSLRERQVMALIVSGLLNKQVGGELGISEITVKFHRGHLMRKMQARSFASLVRMAAALDA
jgi:FixJ family two-component response regulator